MTSTRTRKSQAALFVLRHKVTGLYFQNSDPKRSMWVERLEDALIRAKLRWMVAENEEMVPVRIIPVLIEDEDNQKDCYGRSVEVQRAEGCKCFSDRGLLLTAHCPVHGEAEEE